MNEILAIDVPKIYLKRYIPEFEQNKCIVEELLSQTLLLEKVLESFLYRNEKEKESIQWFILKYSFLPNLLVSALEKIKSIFGEKVQVFLELERDPEEDFDELFIVVKTNEEIKSALQKLDVLDKEWFLEILPLTKNLLNITIETQNEF